MSCILARVRPSQTNAASPWLMAFLGVIQSRPGMFLGDSSVRTLRTYIMAYAQARRELGAPAFGAGEDSLLPQFEAWLAARASSEGRLAELDWAGHIEAVDGGPNNVVTFFRLLREFLARRGQALDEPDIAWRDWPRDKSDFVLGDS